MSEAATLEKEEVSYLDMSDEELSKLDPSVLDQTAPAEAAAPAKK